MAQSKASKRRRRRRRLWGKRKKKTKSDRITCFSLFGKLPQELQNAIWKFSLIEEVRHTIVLFDGETSGLVPSVQLISAISLVGRAPRTFALKFYTVEVPVFDCDREPPDMKAERGRAKGLLRLNFDHTTLLLGYVPDVTLRILFRDGNRIEPRNLHNRDYGYESTADTEGHLSYEDWFGNKAKTAPLRITRSRITAPLTTLQRAQVKRVYEEVDATTLIYDIRPYCCWNCSWKKKYGKDGPLSSPAVKAFPNIWLNRWLFINAIPALVTLLREYALFHQRRLWGSVWRKLVTCRDFPIRRAVDKGDPYGHFRMKDDEEADTDNNQ
ncbi:hypothetical protein E8E14_010483 [Neopestalotiopsis sp. 37M]|nr:hypothetical protein E8E14_010483 [Neopestalotiopsis sp. 37M]